MGSHTPAVHVLLAGRVVAAASGVATCADAVIASSSSDGFDMEPLF